MHAGDQESDLLLPKEVARLLRVQVSTVYSAVSNGRLQAVQVWKGSRKSLLRFRRADIEALLTHTTPIKTTCSCPSRTPRRIP
jgi:excisionase family DNA binding protein